MTVGGRAVATDAGGGDRPHAMSWVLLVVAAVLPLLFLGHWFREDDYLLLYHQGRIPPWKPWGFLAGSDVFFWRPLQGWLVSIVWHAAGLEPLPYNLLSVAGWVVGLWHLERLAVELSGRRVSGPLTLAVMLALAGPTLMIAFWMSLLGAAWGSACALWAVRLWLRHAGDSGGSGAGWSAAAMLAAAILFKESLAVMIGVVVLAPWAAGRGRPAARRWLPLLLPVGVAALTYAASLSLTGAGSDISRFYPRAARSAVPGNVIEMLNALCWPLGASSAVWRTPLHRLSESALATIPWLPFALLAGALVTRHRIAILGCVWAVVGCFPAALLEHNLQNRYLHLPALGLAVAAGALLDRAMSAIPSRRWRLPLALSLGAYALTAVASWGILLRAYDARASYGRALERVFATIELPPESTIILIDGLSPARTNRGLGLREFARLHSGRDDVSCALWSSYNDPRYRTDPGVTYARRVRLDFDGLRFTPRPDGPPAGGPAP